MSIDLEIKEENAYSKDTLRVCSQANQGMRKYMEDEMTFALDEKDNQRAAFFGIFDGHGGKEASLFAKKHLFENIKSHQGFDNDDPEGIKEAIKHGFSVTHLSMKNDIENWTKRKDGHNSTSGTTVTVAIVRKNKLYIAHVGDSAAVLAKKFNNVLVTEELTIDHKPDNSGEIERIESLGGRVAISNGVPRVVWKRPVASQVGKPIPKYEYVPFLAVSRALGDLWSYDQERQRYIVSPEPDIKEIDIVPGKTKFLILASDGLWGVMNASEAVDTVYKFETSSKQESSKRNSSDILIKKSLSLWQKKRSRADNISAIVVFFDKEYANDAEVDIIPTEEDINSGAETDAVEGNEDDTPPMVKSFSNAPMIRQPTFRTEKSLVAHLNCGLIPSKRKNNEVSPLISKKKLKTSPISPTSLNSNEDSHQCKVITVLSSETLYDLQLDQDVGFADDESDIENKRRNSLHSEISSQLSTFNQSISVGEGSK